MNIREHLIVLSGVVLLAFSCAVESNDPPAIAESNLPLGAVQEAYDDNSDLILVSVFDPQGILTARGNYYKGYKHGSWTEYHNNGIPREVTHYDLGVKEGLSSTLDQTGQITSATYYHNSMRHGTSLEYYRSQVKSEKNYVNDKLEGIAKEFYPGGGIQEEAMYEDGVRNGVSRWYDMMGNLSIEYEYKDGELVQ